MHLINKIKYPWVNKLAHTVISKTWSLPRIKCSHWGSHDTADFL